MHTTSQPVQVCCAGGGSGGTEPADLALDAEVSARHLSFIETGRAQPSREMVLPGGHLECRCGAMRS